MTAVAWLAAAALPSAGQAVGGVVCAEHDDNDRCVLWLEVGLAGNPPTVTAEVQGGGGGRQVYCSRGARGAHPLEVRENTVYCQHEQHGWYSQSFDCYFMRDSRVRPDDPRVIVPAGQSEESGAVYRAMCFTDSHPDIPAPNFCSQCTPPDWRPPPHLVLLSSAPDGFGGTADPVPDLLVSAIEELALRGPAIGTAPPAGQGAGLVRLPVWLWNEVSGNNWGSLSQTAGPIAGISVVATAEATGIAWEMGDGVTVRCDEGVAWRAGMNVLDPPCGHAYARASRHQPGGVYEIAATTTWALEWRTEGLPEQRGGEFVLRATSTTSLQIDEIQVVTAR